MGNRRKRDWYGRRLHMVLHNTLAEKEVWSGLAICPRHALRYCQDLQALKYLPMRSIDHPATVTSLRSPQIASHSAYSTGPQLTPIAL